MQRMARMKGQRCCAESPNNVVLQVPLTFQRFPRFLRFLRLPLDARMTLTPVALSGGAR